MVSPSKQRSRDSLLVLVVGLIMLVVVRRCSSFVLVRTRTERIWRRIEGRQYDPPSSWGFLHYPSVGRPAPMRRFPSSRKMTSSTSQENDAAVIVASTDNETSTIVPALPKLIVTCATTEELNDAVKYYIQPHHTVVEMGSQLREVSTSICERCHEAILVDVQRKFPDAHRDPRRTGAMRLPPGQPGQGDERDESFFSHKASFYEIAQ